MDRAEEKARLLPRAAAGTTAGGEAAPPGPMGTGKPGDLPLRDHGLLFGAAQQKMGMLLRRLLLPAWSQLKAVSPAEAAAPGENLAWIHMG